MKKMILLLLCFVLLVGCGKADVTPPPEEVPSPPVEPVASANLVKTIALVDGQEVELAPWTATSPYTVFLPSLDGELILEFSSPVSLDPVPMYAAELTEGDTRLTLPLPGYVREITTPPGLRDAFGKLFYQKQLRVPPLLRLYANTRLLGII